MCDRIDGTETRRKKNLRAYIVRKNRRKIGIG